MEPIEPHNDTLSAVVTQLGLDDFDGTDDETPMQLYIPEIPVPPVQPAPLEVGIPYLVNVTTIKAKYSIFFLFHSE